MRENKYRGKMRDGGRWIYGSLLTWPDGDTYILYDKDFAATGMLNKDPVRPETVGQFLGHHDDQDFYEGDIVEDEWGQRFSIEWCEECAAFLLYDVTDESYVEFGETCVTVIGNIHDNIELLKGERIWKDQENLR